MRLLLGDWKLNELYFYDTEGNMRRNAPLNFISTIIEIFNLSDESVLSELAFYRALIFTGEEERRSNLEYACRGSLDPVIKASADYQKLVIEVLGGEPISEAVPLAAKAQQAVITGFKGLFKKVIDKAEIIGQQLKIEPSSNSSNLGD